MSFLRVRAIPGEPTCYYVESGSLQCTNCARIVKRWPPSFVSFTTRQQVLLQVVGVWPKVEHWLKALADGWAASPRAGDQCKKCGAVMEERWHRVDIQAFNLNGACGCEWFAFTAAKEARRATPDELGAGLWRCQHIAAARDFALDVALAGHRKAEGTDKKDEYEQL